MLDVQRHVYTEAQESFRASVRQFLTDEVLPEYPEWRKSGRPSRLFWRRAGELGILGIGVPVQFGGLPDTDFRHSAVVTEEIQRLGMAIGGLRVQTDICMPYFLHFTTDEQKGRWLPDLVSGRAIAALAMSEPGAGSDVKAMTTRADADGDHYVLNGAKTFISNGAACDLAIVAAKTDPSAGRNGISLFVVDAHSAGFERGRSLDKLGLKAQDLAELSFVDVRVPAHNMLGELNRGFSYLTSNLAQERLSIAVNSQSAAKATLDWAVAALAGPGLSQNAKFELALCATEVAAGQAMIDQALLELVAGTLDGTDAAAAKLYCTELQGRVTERCLRLQGPKGLVGDGPFGDAYFDGRVSRIYGGSSEIMKVIVAQGLGL